MCYCQFLLLCLLVFVLCIEILLCWVHRYLQLCSFSWTDPLIIMCYPSLSFGIFFILGSTLSDMRMLIQLYFAFHLRGIYFSILSLSVYICLLGLKWVSCRQHIYGSCFCIRSASLCLFIGAFKPFTFKVIIDIYVPITIFLIVWGWFCRSLFFSCISWLYKSL